MTMSNRVVISSTSSLIVALLLTGCATLPRSGPSLDRLPSAEYRGHYTTGAGASWFRPCATAAADTAWWVTITGDAVAQVDAARRDGRLVDGRPAFVHWRAALTTGGEVGPRGAGAPALLVREVIALRAAATDDCATR